MTDTQKPTQPDPRLAGLVEYLERRRRSHASRARNARGAGGQRHWMAKRDEFQRWIEAVRDLLDNPPAGGVELKHEDNDFQRFDHISV